MIGAYQPNVTTMSHGRSECRAERTVIQCKLNLSATGCDWQTRRGASTHLPDYNKASGTPARSSHDRTHFVHFPDRTPLHILL